MVSVIVARLKSVFCMMYDALYVCSSLETKLEPGLRVDRLHPEKITSTNFDEDLETSGW